jgi:hypothetical protein
LQSSVWCKNLLFKNVEGSPIEKLIKNEFTVEF